MVLDLFVGAIIAFGFSLVACRALIGAGVVDMPTEPRKTHRAPTPTSGGIGIAFGVALGIVALSMFSFEWRHEITPQGAALASRGAAFAFGFLVLGFIDDIRPLGPRLKFALFTLLALGAALSVGVVRILPIGAHIVELGFVLALIGTALWVFTLVNCVNFMDGANGLAMGSVAIGLAALTLIGVVRDAPSGAAIAACGVGALLGFLIWNFPNGRLFAGDSGALFAGAIAALGSLVVIQRSDLSPFVPPILFMPLLADALLTLAWRVSRRRSVFDGHAEHLYQIAQRAGWGQRRIAVSYWAAMSLCGLTAFAVHDNAMAAVIALTVLAVAAIVISAVVRRAALRAGIAESQ